MASCTKIEDWNIKNIPVRIRNIIQSIKEIVGKHSEIDIYLTLKECNMDPNEAAQKLLYLDTFHEVKRKKDKKKVIAGYKFDVDYRKNTERSLPEKSKKSNNSMPANAHSGGFTGSYVSDSRINKEFRVVRDNRVNQTSKKVAMADSLQHSLGNEHVNSNIADRRSTRTTNELTLINSNIFGGRERSQNLSASYSHVLDHAKDLSRPSKSGALPSKGIVTISQSTSSEPERALVNSSATNSSSNNFGIGVYSSSSDPVHVPSPASRSAGSVGAIRREVGAVGAKNLSSNLQPTNSAISNNSHSLHLDGKAILSSAYSVRDSTANVKSSQLNQVPISNTINTATTNRRSVQIYGKQQRQNFNQPRANQRKMEWKPKGQKQKNDSLPTVEAFSVLPSSIDVTFSSTLTNVIDLSDKLSNANIHEEQRVIIPQHLRVPEAECMKFTFGSFGEGSVSSSGFLSTQAIRSLEQPEVTTSVSNSAFVPDEPIDETSVEVGQLVDCQSATSRSLSPAVAEESEQTPGNNEPLNPQSIESYTDIGLVQSHCSPFSEQSQRIQETSSMPSFSPYDTVTSFVSPFFPTTLDDNVRGQGLASQPEIPNIHSGNSNPNSNPLNAGAITQQQQQQQTLAQIYPQLHVPQYPNYMPYRHIISPVYAPPMALPSYSGNPAYAHPSSGNSYLLMPGGSSILPTGGMKYAPSQYKPVPAVSSVAYGNYSNPAAFAVGTPSPIGGATGVEDMRIKYKDHNLYATNQQAETSDMWIQTPREISSLQSMPYYNLSGHTAHPTAFVSAQAAAASTSGHTSFNTVAATVQPSPMQYPGLYHPPQQASIATPHHIVHQHVPPVGLGAGGPQVGPILQSQLNRLNWTVNF